MSRSAYVQPSSTARARCAPPWFIASPANAPRIRSFQRGAIEPDSAGTNSTPAAPGGASAASAKTSAWEIRCVSASQRVLPPDTKPGFSTSRTPSAACACVSTRPSSSMTAVSAGTATGSAVPVTSTTIPGPRAPAPSAAACSSPVPTTTSHAVDSPIASAASGRRLPATSCEARIGGSLAGSRPACPTSSSFQARVCTS